ncbi:MAG: polysaccharide deacetylase family protein [Phycisphaerae bacterium]|nr:polysaccharide deacetylase family protein [Phycisphaerae bacterium]NUQ48244.1 polysaccharide deacetylase family protein [Phycisphaerae bacterium]
MFEETHLHPAEGMRARLVRWARRYVNAHCINIVTYHGIAPNDDPFTVGLPLRHTPSELAAHMAFLRRHYRPVGLVELIEAVEDGRTLDRAVLVTFDDGLRSVKEHAWPVLRRFEVPIAIFATTSVIGNADLLWRHKLTWLLTHGRAREVFAALRTEYLRRNLDADGTVFPRHVDATPDLYELTRRHFRPDVVPAVLDEVLARHGWSGPALANKFRPYLDPDDLRDADPRWVTFGNHTHTHPLLSALTPAEQRRELGLARELLTRWTGRAPAAVAYPFGLRDSYDAHSVEAARQTGHRAAMDMRRRLNVAPLSPWDLSRKPAPHRDPSAFELLIDNLPAHAIRGAARPVERLQLHRRMFRGAPAPLRWVTRGAPDAEGATP